MSVTLSLFFLFTLLATVEVVGITEDMDQKHLEMVEHDRKVHFGTTTSTKVARVVSYLLVIAVYGGIELLVALAAGLL